MTGHNTSSTSVSVMWGHVPKVHQNGIILNYTITYQSLTQNHNDNVTVHWDKHQTELTGLKKFVNYSITVFASTVKGNGPATHPVFVSTDQDSKFTFSFLVLTFYVLVYWNTFQRLKLISIPIIRQFQRHTSFIFQATYTYQLYLLPI